MCSTCGADVHVDDHRRIEDTGMTAISHRVTQLRRTTTQTVAEAMQSPYVPETPGRSPVIPEESPVEPRPETPGGNPGTDRPQERPAHPDQPEDDGGPSPVAPEALAVRIP